MIPEPAIPHDAPHASPPRPATPPATPPATLRRPRYLDQTCALTLAQGLAEYRASMPDLIDEEGLSPRSLDLFHNHDIAHVVFGCDISFRHEGMVDTWTLFGTDVGWRGFLAYTSVPELRKVFSEVGRFAMFWHTIRGLPACFRAYRHARRMRKRWPWRDHDAHLETPLSAIRADYGIDVCA